MTTTTDYLAQREQALLIRRTEEARKARIFAEFRQFATELNKNLPPIPRTWGVEIESPNMDKVVENMTTSRAEILGKSGRQSDDQPLFFTQDGSVKSEDNDCECDCYECEHECDCENCDRADYLDHSCGMSDCTGLGDYQEVATIGGLDRLDHPAIDALTEAGIENLTYNDTCGIHLNIGSGDLTAPQVARVLSTYRRLAPFMDAIAGRGEVYYSNAPTQYDIDQTHNRQATNKYSHVNTGHHFNHYNNTEAIRLEFRQVAGEQFEGNAELIRAWAWLLVQVVEFAKTSQPIFWLGSCKTLAQLISELSRR